jgi:hypothetical protein
MLEAKALYLELWTRGSQPGDDGASRQRSWRRRVFDDSAATPGRKPRSQVGLAVASRAACWPVPSWFFQPQVAIYESEHGDHALVCRAACRSQGLWHIWDADDHFLGCVSRGSARDHVGPRHAPGGATRLTRFSDCLGRPLATTTEGDHDSKSRIRSTDDVLLAQVRFEPSCTILEYAPASDANPFLRMILLAYVAQHALPTW